MLDIKIIEKNQIEKGGLKGVEFFAQAWLDGEQLGFGKDGTVDIERFLIFKDFGGSEEAEFNALRHVIQQTGKRGTNIISGKRGNTTYTLFPEPNIGTAPIDGVTYQGGDNVTFETLRNGPGDSHLDGTFDEMDIAFLGADTTPNRFDRIARGIIGFPTSVIGTENVDSAVFSLVPATLLQTELGDTDVDLLSASPASESDLNNSDYAIANFGTTRLATGKPISGMVIGTRAEWTLNASGLAHVDGSGNTFFGVLLKWDVDNNFTGTWVSNGTTKLRVFFADKADTVNDPMLVVETSPGGPTTPGVTTQAVTSIAATTATGNGEVVSDGNDTITERGVCWATTTGPTTADSTATSAGTTGVFTASMTALTAGTEYFVRAYATNSQGTAYGEEVTFTTLAAPDAFTVGDWSIADLLTGGSARITISSLPADNGSAITDLEYKIGAGAWTSFASTTTGNYDISGFTNGVSTNVLIRAVNAVGNGADSDTKAVTTTASATAPAQFGAGGWSVTDRATDGEIRIAITTLPDDGGSVITDLEYQIDAGTWVSMSITGLGTFDVTGLTNAQSYDVAVRAVNAVGNGTASATKTVTPTLAPAYVGADTDVIYVLDKSNTTNSTEGEFVAVALSDLKTYFGEVETLAPNAQTGTTYTLALTDLRRPVTMNNASANTLTVPPNSSVAFPIGSYLTVAQLGAGATTIAAGSGVTIRSAETLVLEDQYSTVALTKIGTDEWIISGRLQAA